MIYETTCLEMGLTPDYNMVLDEAGGIVSALARAYTGKDADLPKQIDEELEGVKTEKAKADLLEDIDDFIKEAEASLFARVTMMDKKNWPAELKPDEVAWPGSDLFAKRMAWIKKQTHDNAGQFKMAMARGASGGFIGDIISIGLMRANAQDGTTKKYIAALKAARAKTAAHKIPKE